MKHESYKHYEEVELTAKYEISSVAHPFVAATFPGYCGLAIGIIFSTSGSLMGYRFGQLFVPIDSPNSDPEPAMLFGVVFPWILFLGFSLVGLLLMRFYRRGLRKYHDALVRQLVLAARGERQELPVLQRLIIEWPRLFLGLILLGAISYGDSAQGGAWSMSCLGGLLASVMTTYVERKQIYDEAVNASSEANPAGGSPSSISNLSVRVRALLASLAMLLCILSLVFVWYTGRMVVVAGKILDITQPQ